MSHGETSRGTPESDSQEQSSDSSEASGPTTRVRSTVGERARSGALAGALGGASVFGGILSLQAGQRTRGLRRMAAGGALLAVAAVQRRARGDGSGASIDIDESDVVDTAPDIDAVGDAEAEQAHASGDEAAEVVDTGPALDEVDADVGGGSESPTGAGPVSEGEQASEPGSESGTESETEPEGDTESEGEAEGDTESESEPEGESGAASVEYDRLGSAAFDEHSNEVPVPQRAFNQGYLAFDAEAVWGIRDDDAVVVSQLYDPIEGAEGVRYVASTQVDEERILTVPDGVLDHWDGVSGGPVAVESGDDIVFATSDDLGDDDQLIVVPAAWADDVLGDE